MATIQNIPEDVLETHILPLATEQEKLREKIKDLEEVIEKQKEELKEQQKNILLQQDELNTRHKQHKKDDKKLKYYKGQVDYLVSSSSNYSYSDDY